MFLVLLPVISVPQNLMKVLLELARLVQQIVQHVLQLVVRNVSKAIIK